MTDENKELENKDNVSTENDAQNNERRPRVNLNTPVIRKVCLAALIFGLLQIPLYMIKGVIDERQKFNVDYPLTYKGTGAGAQTITGPILTIPYVYETTEPISSTEAVTPSVVPGLPPVGSGSSSNSGNSNVSSSTAPDEIDPVTGRRPSDPPPPPVTLPSPVSSAKNISAESKSAATMNAETSKAAVRKAIGYLHFFPETLDVDGKVVPDIRDEGKFKSILYTTDLKFKGAFNTSDLRTKNISPDKVQWQNAYLSLGITDLRGVTKATTLDWAGSKFKFAPGTNGLTMLPSGQHVPLTGIESGGLFPFSFSLSLNGSRDLNVFPGGKENKIVLTSSWSEPSFIGGFLPSNKSIDESGFSAQWDVSYFMRNLPQVWTDKDQSIANSLAQYMVGVSLATPIEFYRTAERAVKYGSLFISMTFVTFFLFEMMTKVRIHEIQYLFVGLALCLFFLMLIAISEWVPFMWAYVLATVPTIVQITSYTRAFTKGASRHLWKVTASTLTILYSYLYVLLQLEDASLLLGSIGLFIALSAVLFVTRNINWYSEEAKLS